MDAARGGGCGRGAEEIFTWRVAGQVYLGVGATAEDKFYSSNHYNRSVRCSLEDENEILLL